MLSSRRWILCVEDNEDDLVIIRDLLPQNEFPVTWAVNGHEARERLESTVFDLVLLDHTLPDTNGLKFLSEIKKSYPEIPVIILTGREDDALALAATQQGASSFVVKKRVKEELRPAIEKALLHARKASAALPLDETESSLPLERMRHFYQALLSMMNEGVMLIDKDGVITYANAFCGELYGCDANDLLGRNLGDCLDSKTNQMLQEFLESADPLRHEGAGSGRMEGRAIVAGNRREVPILCSVRAVDERLRKYHSCLIVITDISETVANRESLRMKLVELERFQRFFVERETRVIELKEKIRDLERKLGIESPGLSPETRQTMERRLQAIRPAGEQ